MVQELKALQAASKEYKVKEGESKGEGAKEGESKGEGETSKGDSKAPSASPFTVQTEGDINTDSGKWIVSFKGPAGSPYSAGTFKLCVCALRAPWLSHCMQACRVSTKVSD